MMDDKSSAKIARDIAKKIESEMQYPGEIKVTVLREVRTVEYAPPAAWTVYRVSPSRTPWLPTPPQRFTR
jgi:hypothetical protein